MEEEPESPRNSGELIEFGGSYAAAWSSQDAVQVALCFSDGGSLTINAGRPARGHQEIAEVAREYMEAFPDLVVEFDRIEAVEDELHWHWTMKGTNTGPGGSGNSICISGYEALLLDSDLKIISAHGHYDEDEYERQLSGVT